jgi:hypothetical protein
MKSSVAVALIFCGTLLVSLPFIQNMFLSMRLTEALMYTKQHVDFTVPFPESAHTLCMFGGFLMILVGAISGMFTGESHTSEQK